MSLSSGRRRMLALLGGVGAMGLSGCCGLRPFPPSRIAQEPDPRLVRSPFLRPTLTEAADKPFKYCLDAHAHFFNASDVNVKGYLAGPVAHSLPSRALRDFLRALAPIVDEIAGLAPDADTEYRWLLARAAALQMLSLQERNRVLEDATRAHRDRIAQELFDRMRARNLGETYLRLERTEQPSDERAIARPTEAFTLDTVRRAVDPAARRAQSLRSLGLQAPSARSADSGGVLEFVGHMLSYRWMTLKTYQKFYAEDEGALGIDGAFGSLVDFDYWLDCPSRSSRPDQVKVQALLCLVSGGYMLPLVSYNPWTDIKRAGESLDLVKVAIEQWGFVGVKIYPPMGYFPYGNEQYKDEIATDKPRPNLLEVDQRLEALFDYCLAAEVPVMAHTGESMGRDDPSDGFGGPKGWDALLARFSSKGAPLVQAAHFGDDLPKEGGPANAWPRELAKLMAGPNGAGLYGDLGYWTALRRCGGPQDAECARARARLEDALAQFPDATGRVMYGSDWFMLSKEADWPAYPRQLARNLDHLFPPQDLFYWNAVRCFGLRSGDPNRKRMEKRFAEVPGGLPEWLKKA